MTAFKSALGEARGLGSAKEGFSHWWLQRVSAIFLLPLSLWFVCSFIGIAGEGQREISVWFSSPLVAIAVILLMCTVFFHSYLGLKVVIEDYVHSKMPKLCMLVGAKFLLILLSLVSVISVMKLHFMDLLV